LREAETRSTLEAPRRGAASIEKEQWSPTRAFRPGRAEQRTFMSPTGASGRGAERDPVKSEVDAGPARTSLPIDERQSRRRGSFRSKETSEKPGAVLDREAPLRRRPVPHVRE